MKGLTCFVLILAMLLALAACGGEPDPNVGVYVAETAEMSGISISVDSVFDGGLTFNLKDGGRAVMTTGGQDYNLRWALDGEELTITAADGEYTGTLVDGTMILHFSSDVTVTFSKEG